jgi:exosome complex component RRP40
MDQSQPFSSRTLPLKYCSEQGDLVIGRIIDRQGEHYRVDTGDRFESLLQYYDFEGASKRNRPSFESGDLVYSRVQRTSLNSGALLTCKSLTNKKTWSSGESEFGPLTGGYLMSVPISTCQK